VSRLKTEFVVPRLFAEQKQFTSLPVDDFSWIEYRQYEPQHRSRVLITTSIFVVILSGRKIIHSETGDIILEPGSAFFAKKGSYIMSEILSSEKTYRTLLFFIGDNFLDSFLTNNSPGGSNSKGMPSQVSFFTIEISPLLQSSIQSAIPYFLFDSGYSNKLIGLKMQEVLLNIIDADENGNFLAFLQNLYSERRQDLHLLMDKYYRKPVTIEELASLSGRSLSSFKRDFRNVFNDSPKRWINNRRLETARLLLLNSEQNISEVCFEVGFENISYFSQIFKKKFGHPPSLLLKNRN
jgi:AraC family transcriptional regulator, exoenzyme S synthesis regulatory protein ExsA